MSPKLPRITATETIRALHRDGWQDDRQGGSHVILVHHTKPGIVVVPMHKGKDLPTGLLGKILKDAGLTIDELRRLL